MNVSDFDFSPAVESFEPFCGPMPSADVSPEACQAPAPLDVFVMATASDDCAAAVVLPYEPASSSSDACWESQASAEQVLAQLTSTDIVPADPEQAQQASAALSQLLAAQDESNAEQLAPAIAFWTEIGLTSLGDSGSPAVESQEILDTGTWRDSAASSSGADAAPSADGTPVASSADLARRAQYEAMGYTPSQIESMTYALTQFAARAGVNVDDIRIAASAPGPSAMDWALAQGPSGNYDGVSAFDRNSGGNDASGGVGSDFGGDYESFAGVSETQLTDDEVVSYLESFEGHGAYTGPDFDIMQGLDGASADGSTTTPVFEDYASMPISPGSATTYAAWEAQAAQGAALIGASVPATVQDIAAHATVGVHVLNADGTIGAVGSAGIARTMIDGEERLVVLTAGHVIAAAINGDAGPSELGSASMALQTSSGQIVPLPVDRAIVLTNITVGENGRYSTQGGSASATYEGAMIVLPADTAAALGDPSTYPRLATRAPEGAAYQAGLPGFTDGQLSSANGDHRRLVISEVTMQGIDARGMLNGEASTSSTNPPHGFGSSGGPLLAIEDGEVVIAGIFATSAPVSPPGEDDPVDLDHQSVGYSPVFADPRLGATFTGPQPPPAP